MTTEQKQLLIKDLSARLPYGVRIAKANVIYPMTEVNIALGYVELAVSERISIEEARPYLRPMESMTEEEKRDYQYITERWMYDASYSIGDSLDYLNAHYLDYRGLIEKGLALPAPEGMYDTKSKSGSHKYFPSEFGSYEEYAEYLKKNSYALDAPEKGIK